MAYLTIKSKRKSTATILTPPTKTTYYVGERFNPTGMTIRVTYSDGVIKDITSIDYDSNAFPVLTKQDTEQILTIVDSDNNNYTVYRLIQDITVLDSPVCTSCEGTCTTVCSTTCYGTCAIDCGGSCSTACGNCGASCGMACVGDCSGSCGSGCSNTCSDSCSEDCVGGCSGCGSGCGSGCSSSCADGCDSSSRAITQSGIVIESISSEEN